jgi:hypothetical protein
LWGAAFPLPSAGNLLERAAARDRERLLLEHVVRAVPPRSLVIGLDQQPGLLPLLCARADAHKMPATLELLAVEREGQPTLLQSPVRIAFRMPAAAIPDHDRAGAITLRYRALELVVVDRMVLDLDREALLGWIKAGPAGYRPALHDPVELEPQIIMETARRMLLDHITMAGLPRPLPARLGRDPEIALLAVEIEAHGKARAFEGFPRHATGWRQATGYRPPQRLLKRRSERERPRLSPGSAGVWLGAGPEMGTRKSSLALRGILLNSPRRRAGERTCMVQDLW